MDDEENEYAKQELKDNNEAKEKEETKSAVGPVIQRSVAFDLSDDEEKPSEKRVTISKVTINDKDCDNNDSANQSDKNDRSSRKDSTALKKEIIGILKPPNPKKELKSFPSLPECFLHDLGLIENIALNAENLSEQDIENKFSSLSLAFKTDRVTLQERLELQHRQRDIAERNAEDEIRQLKTSIRSLNRVCQDSETREVLQRVEKQVQVLQQSTGRVSSSSEQFGAVQQEARVATAIEIMLLHVDNLKRSYEKEHNELEETRRILIEHKLLVDEPNISHDVRSIRNRSVSVMHSSVHSELSKPRRASVATSVAQKHLGVGNHESSVRSRSPNHIQKATRKLPACGTMPMSEETVWGGVNPDKKGSVFTPIQETGEDGKEEDQEMVKNDDNNNSNTENMNKNSSTAGLANLDMRRKESRKPSHFDINTIMEEIDDLAQKRDSSPTPPSSQPLPKTAREFIQRKKSLLIHIQDWYEDLYWPYDEDETILGIRYCISGILTATAVFILMSTFFG